MFFLSLLWSCTQSLPFHVSCYPSNLHFHSHFFLSFDQGRQSICRNSVILVYSSLVSFVLSIWFLFRSILCVCVCFLSLFQTDSSLNYNILVKIPNSSHAIHTSLTLTHIITVVLTPHSRSASINQTSASCPKHPTPSWSAAWSSWWLRRLWGGWICPRPSHGSRLLRACRTWRWWARGISSWRWFSPRTLGPDEPGSGPCPSSGAAPAVWTDGWWVTISGWEEQKPKKTTTTPRFVNFTSVCLPACMHTCMYAGLYVCILTAKRNYTQLVFSLFWANTAKYSGVNKQNDSNLDRILGCSPRPQRCFRLYSLGTTYIDKSCSSGWDQPSKPISEVRVGLQMGI